MEPDLKWYDKSPPEWLYAATLVIGVIAIILGIIRWFV